ncbi:aldo/keto reductase [Tunicatimonas pelagia]|uniref:aldo/keto reductase n=1 Tax=Tunicatimonas pelagia TaxID=931531 RepID=UPI002665057C|nr:aldo/keto reductase [Tunicatimonas pelagia]WKN42795.1 aldo/keto reductase [Tunicatimonas pelagia]
MKKSDSPTPSLSRRNFLTVASAASAGLSSLGLQAAQAKSDQPKKTEVVQEWRNRQSDMAYRQLGRTGMMISEVVCGGDPVRFGNTRPVELAMDKGLNYLDMAPAYGNGECEEAYSQVIDSSSKREKVFITTKVSGFAAVRDQLYRDIYNELPTGKQEAIMKRAQEIRQDRAVDKPGYFLKYWSGQAESMDSAFLANAMIKDYAHRVEGSQAYRDKIMSSIEGSLKRTGFGYFDILMCPHGADCPEEVQIPEIYETFALLKKEGKARFLGVSTHNDPAGVLRAAAATGEYDTAMCAYNIINGGYLEDAIRQAHESGMGIIAMKAAMAVATHHKAIQPIPSWRIDKVERIVPGDMKAPMKAYVWALQNPHISAVISNLWDEQYVNENLSVAGKRVELQPG